MSEHNSTEYYMSREQRERELASMAESPMISAIHLDMAKRYAQLISESLMQVARRR